MAHPSASQIRRTWLRLISASPEYGGSAEEHLVDTSLPVVATVHNLIRVFEVLISRAAIVGAVSEFLCVLLDGAVKEPETQLGMTADLMGAAPGPRPAV